MKTALTVALFALTITSFALAQPKPNPKPNEFAELFACHQAVLKLYHHPYTDSGKSNASYGVIDMSTFTLANAIVIPKKTAPVGYYAYDSAGARSFFTTADKKDYGKLDSVTKYHKLKLGKTTIFINEPIRGGLRVALDRDTTMDDGTDAYKPVKASAPDDAALREQIENAVVGQFINGKDFPFCDHYAEELRLNPKVKDSRRKAFSDALTQCEKVANQKINAAADASLVQCGLKDPNAEPVLSPSKQAGDVKNKVAPSGKKPESVKKPSPEMIIDVK